MASQPNKSLRPKKISEKSLANLRPYKPGQSGNPGGKRKHDIAADIAVAILTDNQAEIYKALGKKLLKGDAYAFEKLADRGFGKVPQKVTADVHISTDPTERFRELVAGILERPAGESDAGRE